jgi:PAS domain-containing protein
VTLPPAKKPSIAGPYLWGAVLVLVCGLARWSLSPSLGIRFPFITLFFAVFCAAWIGGLGPALLATVLSLVFALFFLFPPYGTLPPFSTETTIGVVLFLLNGIAVAWLGEARLRAFRDAQRAFRLAQEQGKLAEESAAMAQEQAARAEEETARAEEESDRAEREATRIKTILEGIGDGFYTLDRQWRLVYVNERAAEAMRRPRSELTGLNLWELFPQAVGSVFQREFERAVQEQKMVTLEDYSLVTGRYMSVRAYPTQEGLSVFFEDMTAQHEAARALEESEERLRLATDVGKFGIWDWDIVKNRVTWSPRIYEFHGLKPSEFAGTVEAFRALVHPADAGMLSELGYQPVSAASGHEALAALGKDGTRVDLVLTDIAMPGMGGRELGDQVAREFPGLPVVYMSGYTDQDVVARGLLEKDTPFIQKPFLPEGLARYLRQVLDGRDGPRA